MDFSERLTMLRAAEGDPALLALATVELVHSELPIEERENIRRALLAAAVPHWFDPPFLGSLLAVDEPEAERLHVKLCALMAVEPFSARGERAVNVHESARLALREHLRKSDPEQWQTLAERARAHVAASSSIHARIEALHHLFAIDQEAAGAECETLDREFMNNPEGSQALAISLSEMAATGWVTSMIKYSSPSLPVSMTNYYPGMYNHNKLDIRKFFQATNPDRALFADNNKEDSNYYIDFSSVRGGQVIEDLKKTISFFSPNQPTCQLFTGHIGCGKSTELQKLKVELQQEGFHVVYFDSHKDLEMSDLDVSDIMLAIIHRVSESLENAGIKLEPNYFKSLFADIKNTFLTPINLELKLSFLIAEITTQTRASPNLRTKLRDVLEPKISKILEEINAQILKPGIKELKRKQKKGLVVIVDSFEKIDNVPKRWDRAQHEYLFIDRGMQLSSLACHLVYTMPLSLRFSNEYGLLTQRFQDPKVLPMVRVKTRDGEDCQEGLEKLRNMVLARAFPELNNEQRFGKVTEVFDSPETLDYLCRASGGHIRNLMRLLNTSIQKEMRFPITRYSLESVIIDFRSERILAIDQHEWNLLRQVKQNKKITGDDGYQALIRSMFVYEYRDSAGHWFDINPILSGAKELC